MRILGDSKDSFRTLLVHQRRWMHARSVVPRASEAWHPCSPLAMHPRCSVLRRSRRPPSPALRNLRGLDHALHLHLVPDPAPFATLSSALRNCQPIAPCPPLALLISQNSPMRAQRPCATRYLERLNALSTIRIADETISTQSQLRLSSPLRPCSCSPSHSHISFVLTSKLAKPASALRIDLGTFASLGRRLSAPALLRLSYPILALLLRAQPRPPTYINTALVFS